MSNGKRNRTAGHKWERTCAKRLREAGFTHVVTSRAESKSRDDSKVDLMNKDEYKNGRLPYNFQCKSTTQNTNYYKLLKELPQGSPELNIILHEKTEKRGEKFVKVGEFAIMEADAFFELITELERVNAEFDATLKEIHDRID